MSCQFVVIPAEAPAIIVPCHPSASAVSDHLGGAIPGAVSLHESTGCMWVRQSAAEEGLPVNVVASVVATLFNGYSFGPRLVLGTGVLTALMPSTARGAYDAAEGWSAPTARRLAAVVSDVREALAGGNGPFATGELPKTWPTQIREMGVALRNEPVPPDWPEYPLPVDRLIAILAAAFPGRTFATYML